MPLVFRYIDQLSGAILFKISEKVRSLLYKACYLGLTFSLITFSYSMYGALFVVDYQLPFSSILLFPSALIMTFSAAGLVVATP